jgi:hypothetical protein
MSAASDLHNLLSARFVRDVIGPSVKNGATYAGLLVLFESVQFEALDGAVQAFLAEAGDDRRDAAAIALAAGQVDRLTAAPDLYSEDLW